MECDLFPGHHRAQNMSSKVNQLLIKNNIEPCNIVCWVTDCEPSNNAAAGHVPFEWNGCFDHLLQLITKQNNELFKNTMDAKIFM